ISLFLLVATPLQQADSPQLVSTDWGRYRPAAGPRKFAAPRRRPNDRQRSRTFCDPAACRTGLGDRPTAKVHLLWDPPLIPRPIFHPATVLVPVDRSLADGSLAPSRGTGTRRPPENDAWRAARDRS